MAEEVEAALMTTIGERRFPKRYIDLKLCRELHLSLTEIGEMPEEDYQMWLAFLSAEFNAHDAAARHAEFLASRKA